MCAAPPTDRPLEPLACPCGSGLAYVACCGRLHVGDVEAGQPEQLMRARYSAFALGDEAYLLHTWHPDTRPPAIGFDPAQRWVELEVLATTGGHLFDEEGTVEFRAAFEQHRRRHVLQELSRFVRVDGRWVYLGPLASDVT